MSVLAASSSCTDWNAAYALYDERILAHSKTGKRRAKLVALDGFVRNDIPTRLEARLANDDSGSSKRPDGYLTKEEVCKIVEWKITVRSIVPSELEWRGSFELSRRRLLEPAERQIQVRRDTYSQDQSCGQSFHADRPLMRYANALNATEVEDVTASAFEFSQAGADLSSVSSARPSSVPYTDRAVIGTGARDPHLAEGYRSGDRERHPLLRVPRRRLPFPVGRGHACVRNRGQGRQA